MQKRDTEWEICRKTLDELIQADPQSILGEKQLHQMLRLAYLDAREDLSIQVHPYDEYARAHENDEGKTESGIFWKQIRELRW